MDEVRERDRVSVMMRTWKVVYSLDTNYKTVNRVVTRYFNLCREDAMSGKIVNITGFLTLTPNIIYNEYSDTTSMYAMRVAECENLPYFTVKTIIRTYLDMCKDELLAGKPVVFYKVASLTPLIDTSDNSLTIYLVLSATIRNQLRLSNTDVVSVRAHLSKTLKSEVGLVDVDTIDMFE